MIFKKLLVSRGLGICRYVSNRAIRGRSRIRIRISRNRGI